MHSILITALIVISVATLVIWHFVFLMAINNRYDRRRASQNANLRGHALR